MSGSGTVNLPTNEELRIIDGKLTEFSLNEEVPSFTAREREILRAGLRGDARGFNPTGPRPDERKFEMVKMHAEENGFCYLLLLLSCPAVVFCDEIVLFNIMRDIKENLGKFPSGQEVLPYITSANIYMSGRQDVPFDSTGEMEKGNPASFIDSLKILMNSPLRLEYKIENDNIHLSTTLNKPCVCDSNVMCDHGFYMKFIYSILTTRGHTVGGDLNIDFSTFFVEDEQAHESEEATVLPLNTKDRQAKRRDSVLSTEQIVDPAGRVLNRAMSEIDIVASENEAKMRGKRELFPDDSSSSLGRYAEHRRFMDYGTVLSMSREENYIERFNKGPAMVNRIDPTEANGFLMTNAMYKADEESRARLNVINGLAQPYSNKRLNLLLHIHTAMETSAFPREGSLVKVFSEFHKFCATSPTELLFVQLLTRTFNFRDMVVVSNPYKLPFVEIGMVVSEVCLRKVLDLLYAEFELLWFCEMKNLKVPKFSKRYDNVSESFAKFQEAGKRPSNTSSRVEKPEKIYYKERPKSSKNSVLGIRL